MDSDRFAACAPAVPADLRRRLVTRLILVTLIALLAMPVAALTPPDTTTSRGGGTSVEAKGKKGKKNDKKDRPDTPQYTTVTRTIRQPVAQTFSNTSPITIPAGAPGISLGKATPYSSNIVVSGLPASSSITDINLILTDLSHGFPRDIDILLSGDSGRRALVMSDAGSSSDVATNVNLTLDDEAAAPLPTSSALASGSFQPTNIAGGGDLFPDGAPSPGTDVALSTFDGAPANGTWRLWVMDDGDEDVGGIGGGWALQITAEHDVQVEEQVLVPKDTKNKKKHKKKGKR